MLTRKIARRYIFSSRCTEIPFFSAISCRNNFISRNGHTDIKVPDFSNDMRPSVEDPRNRSAHTEDSRRLFSYALTGTCWTAGLYGIKSDITRYVKYMDVSADVLAMAKMEVNLDSIPEDKHVTYKWRNKPIFVWHRTEEAIKAVREVPLSVLKDPQEDSERVIDPRFLVVIGVCTHLGCIPISHSGDYGGYYCPCHGSHYDIAGRARKGPAPTNLEIPEYTISGNTLIVG